MLDECRLGLGSGVVVTGGGSVGRGVFLMLNLDMAWILFEMNVLLSVLPVMLLKGDGIEVWLKPEIRGRNRNLIDTASGGALTNKTIDEATELIENMVANTQQFNTRGVSMSRRFNEVTSSPHLEHRIGNMEKMMQQMAAVIIPSYEEEAEQRDNPNFSYANKQDAAQGPVFNRPSGFQQQQQQQQPQPVQNSESSEMLAMMKNLTTMVQKNQQTTDGAIKELQTQMSTMEGRLNHLETQNSGKLPSQTLNPRDSVNVVTLRSGTRTVQPEDNEKNKDPKGPVLENEIIDSSQTDEAPKENSKTLVSTYVPPLPFPRRFANSKKAEQDKEILDIFRKIHVNIPLIDAIKQVPKYSRILKDLCTNKQRSIGNELADRSNVYPRGIIEDVLVQAPKLELKPLPDHIK
ncbi:uncharacterized protein LOC113316068 [Papaver somniferum]|uniref:uncharacterized protein LOC113316068 n=1 Tax=Papaver somniferum TaxID=3469 RepID=UPI000E705658|nr:uncharacterized protein LOC113316068 [Papaver somniferum]